MSRIWITTLEYPPDVGGVGESASRIAKMLMGLGYEVHVAVFRAIFRREKQEAQDGQFHRSYRETSVRDGVTQSSTIAIAHDLKTLSNSDRIFKLEGDKI